MLNLLQRMLADQINAPEVQALQFGRFRLKLHDKHPTAPESPIYFDLRYLQSSVRAMRTAASVLEEQLNVAGLLGGRIFDRIAGVPVAGLCHATNLSMRTGIGMVTPREPKTHGSLKLVDGRYKDGQAVLLVDDTLTSGESLLEAAHKLRRGGLRIDHAIVLVDREQGGRVRLEQAGVCLHAPLTISFLLQYYLSDRQITPAQFDEVEAYKVSHKTFMASRN